MKMDATLTAAFQTQVSIEIRNALAYLAAYSVLRAAGWRGFAKCAEKDSHGEFAHGHAFVEYMARREEACTVIPHEYLATATDPKSFAALAASLEDETENSMRQLALEATRCADVGAIEYISGKLVEQEKESQDARDFAARIAECGPDSLVLIDRELEG
jgi:ferritin